MKIRRVSATLLVLSLIGMAFLSPGAADHDTIANISLGNAYFVDFDESDGGWDTPEIPPRPEPANPSWEWGGFVADPPRGVENPSWEWGTPTSGPGAAASGSNVWATNLAGAYNSNECSGILSPPITIPVGATASLSFLDWRHIDASTFSGSGIDGGMLFATTDAGSTLDRIVPTGGYDDSLFSTPRSCLDGQPTGTEGFAGPAGSTPPGPSYGTVEVDLSGYAGQTIQILLGLGTNCCTEREGWYMDDWTVTIDGTSTVEDFETSDGGFSVVGVRPVELVGPRVAHSGDNVWATSVNTPHNSRECSAIMSPPITIPAGAADASVSFMEWHHMQRFTSTLYDVGRLLVTEDSGLTFEHIAAPVPAYDSVNLLTSTADCFNGMDRGEGGYSGPSGSSEPAPTYSQVSADLTAYAGRTVQFVIAFGSSSSTERAGWYIDDFTVTIDGVSVVEDFETSDGGFTVTTTALPDQRGWSWGAKTGSEGPDIPDGTNVWATGGPNGDHGKDECTWIESPLIDIEGEMGTGLPATNATLRWQQWYRGSSFSSAGVVQIGWMNTTSGQREYSIVEPTTGYTADPSSTDLNACTGHRDAGTGAFGGFESNGDPMLDYSADISAYLGQSITVRFLFASTSTTNPGWFIGGVEVEESTYLGWPHLPDPPVPTPSGADAPLWTSGGEASSWAYGVSTDSSSNAEAWAGETGYGTNLGGSHNAPECSWVQSPAIPGALLAGDPNLVFEHAYRIAGASVDVAWGGGLVQVSTDGGVTWEYLDLPEYDRPLDYSGGYPECFTGLGAPLDGNVFSGAHHTEFEEVSVDLSAYSTAPSVQVRFVFGASSAFAYEGWFIRSVELAGQSLLL